jgi:hypothetical protein
LLNGGQAGGSGNDRLVPGIEDETEEQDGGDSAYDLCEVRGFFAFLEDPPDPVGPCGTEYRQETYGNFFRQPDRNFRISIPGIRGDVDWCSGHSAFLYFPVSQFPVDVDRLVFTFAQPD